MKLGHRLLLILVLVSGGVPGLRADECGDSFERWNGYTVRKVDILSPTSFFPAVSYSFEDAKNDLPLKPGEPFQLEKLNGGLPVIQQSIRESWAGLSGKLKFIVVIGRPVECNSSDRSLRVVYRVFTNISRPLLSHTFEERAAEVERPATTGAEGSTQGRFLIKPLGGYNRSVHGYGGIAASIRVPLNYLKTFDLNSSFSSNSSVVDLDASGGVDPRRRWLDHAQWSMGFHYFDLPSGNNKIKEGKLAAQFLGSTKELSDTGAILRFGGSLQGGNQQTGGTDLQSAVPDSSLGLVKLYVGATARGDRQTFAGSYGLELGSISGGSTLDFSKHILDFDYGVRILPVPQVGELTPIQPGVHRPLDIGIHASAGMIQNGARAPITERFFGGNHVQNFVVGNTWIVPAGATIRSIPQNLLGAVPYNGAIGGTRFYSGNLTVGKVLWGRPLLPEELATDRQFVPALKFALNTAVGEMTDYYKTQDPAFQATRTVLDDLATLVPNISAALDRIPGTSTATIRSGARSIRSKLSKLSRTIAQIRTHDKGEVTNVINPQLPRLSLELKNLGAQLAAEGQADLATTMGSFSEVLQKARQNLVDDVAKIDAKAAQAHADADFAPAHKVLRSFLYELNIYSIAPVAIFDVARVWPSPTGTRYGVGGGVRLSLVNVNFTLGYAANPKRNPGEGAGALFVSLDVTDLFH